jgi:tRNA-dihydrouridine synthase
VLRCPPLWLAPLALPGGHVLPCRILPGPMEGISTGAFCAVMNRLDLVQAWVTPFIRVSEGVLRPARIRERLQPYAPLPVIVQLMGTDIPLLVETAERLVAQPGVIGIDLNCACPMPIVVANGGGGGRLRHPRWISEALRALRRACPRVGLSVKVRTGLHSDHELPQICEALIEGRPDFVVMHFRTVKERYGAAPDGVRRLARARQLMPDLPLLGSGDLSSVDAAARMFDIAGVDGVTPARGLLANPWLLRDIEADCRGEQREAPAEPVLRAFIGQLNDEAERTGTWRRGFVLEVARHQFGRRHPVFEQLLKAKTSEEIRTTLVEARSQKPEARSQKQVASSR